MNIILAFYNVDFAKSFKEKMVPLGINVIDIVSSDEDLIEILKHHKDVDGILLKSDLAFKLGEQRLETLTDILISIRETSSFKDLVVTVLSDEELGHPFLAELVEMGIYNIFVKGESGFTVKNVVETFETPRSFASAIKYRKVDSSIAWRRNLVKQSTVKIEFSQVVEDTKQSIDSTESTDGIEEADAENTAKIKLPKFTLPKFKKGGQEEPQSQVPENPTTPIKTDEDWIYDGDVFSGDAGRKFEQVIGTVLIGVAGVAPHIGCTHTAISIAKHLSEKGHSVALVEGNHSLDFDRIHSLYEGAKETLKTVNFELNGIMHFKYRDELDLNVIFTSYEYVVLDLGVLEESPYRDEFNRSHVKCIVSSADEWKFHWCEEFLQVYKELENLTFLVPNANKKVTDDLQARLKTHPAFPIPPHESPYELTDGTNKVLSYVFGKYYKKPSQTNGKTLILVSLCSVAVTAIIFAALTLF